MEFLGSFVTQNSHSYAFKGSKMLMDFNYRYLSFMASIGVDITGKFYVSDEELTPEQAEGCYFTTGYRIYENLKSKYSK